MNKDVMFLKIMVALKISITTLVYANLSKVVVVCLLHDKDKLKIVTCV